MERIIGAIVAIILGLLAMAGVGLMASDGFGSDKASKVTTDITQTMSNARGQFMQNTNYTNFTTANIPAMITSGIFPAPMVRGNALVDRWGNAVVLNNTNNGTVGTIQFGGGGSETAKQCASVVTSIKDYVSLTVGGVMFTPQNQPDAVSAGAACGTSLQITVAFQ
ncbi:prepilin type IV pili [Burkholderia cenocepacia]|uniref:prepilin type IV pili n=1 Tax=Burkholderia cenocepacia TaxID=95486 RepID=UPI0013DE8EF5|nr:prepilin type IV pili [Burkholderia cenocepacia]MCW3587383.1 prepilin type IV pili [Burkholderia cenocepacia]MCW3632587.1 prepilin type IV pili [Burkholderia cenocepacia]MCW5181818.1 prepilin type IV pili [Burkholderia cenocepacia]NGO98053.1 prepilin type IV pili [Burkholderia cenocepacia]